YRWAKPIAGNYTAESYSIAADAQNNIFVAGYFRGTYNFGNQTLTTPKYGDYNGFLAKYTSAGGPVWAKGLLGVGDQKLAAVAVDSAGHSVVTGGITGTATLGSQSLTTVSGSTDIILGRLDP